MGLLGLPFLIFIERRGEGQAASAGAPWPLLAVMFVLGIMLTTLEYAVFGHMALSAMRGERVDFWQACRAALSRLFTLIAVGLLTVIAVAFGLVLLILPGIYIGLGLSMAFMVVMAEGQGAMASLKRSWRLADGLRPRIFGLLLVWALLNAVLSYATGGVFQLFGVESGPLIKSLENALAGALVAPLYGLSLALVYTQAREAKEGHDLAVAAQQLPGAEMPAVRA
jgi:hypothetical protein